MAQLSYLPQNQVEETAAPTQPMLGWTKDWRIRLVALLFFVELFVSFLLWKAGLPRSTDVLKEAIALGFIVVTLATMLVRDRIPLVMVLIFSITLIWGAVALFEGQSIGATLWGWFRFFKYPFVGVFVYLIMRWPPNFAQWLLKFCVWLLAFEVVVQLIQFASGVPPSDSLAGTFGWKGVSELTMLVFFVVCLGFGHWLATHKWSVLVATIVLGLIACLLDVTKFYFPAIAVLAIVVLIISMVRGGKIRQLFAYVILFSLIGSVAISLFDTYIASARGLRTFEEYLSRDFVESYLFNDGDGDEDGQYNLGNGLSIAYGWQTLNRDPTTLLFGYGLGSRTASTSLGLAGSSLEQDLYGGASGTGVLIFMQEFGTVGIALFLSFNLWITLTFFRDAKTRSDRHLATIQYGLVLFTLFWPLWLWYTKPWNVGVMMILYWCSLGYVYRQMWMRGKETVAAAEEPESYPVIPISASANGAAPGHSIVARPARHGR